MKPNKILFESINQAKCHEIIKESTKYVLIKLHSKRFIYNWFPGSNTFESIRNFVKFAYENEKEKYVDRIFLYWPSLDKSEVISRETESQTQLHKFIKTRYINLEEGEESGK
jgi:hypothetical protein